MTFAEFGEIIGMLELATGQPIHANNTKATKRTKLYWDMLADLPRDALRVAAEQLVSERKWPTFPQVAEIRELAVSALRGQAVALTTGEAWFLAWHAVGKIDPEQTGKGVDGMSQAERVLSKLPPMIQAAIAAYGLRSLCYGKEPLTVVRAQWCKIYESLAKREERIGVLPASTKEKMAALATQTAAIGMIEE